MFKLNKRLKSPEPPIVEQRQEDPGIVLGVVVDGEIVDKFAVSNPRVASLFLSNPTFIDLSGQDKE